MVDNTALLTSGGKVYSKKRKAKQEQVEEVAFDPKARRTFLTGFHKRKVERRERAVTLAKEKERSERLELRREKRDQEREVIAQKIRENKIFYGIPLSEDEDEDEAGSESDKDVSVLTGEQSVTTVTVTKDFDPTNFDDESLGLKKMTPKELALDLKKKAAKAEMSESEEEDKKKKAPKKKTKKFRYETHAKRKDRNSKAAATKSKIAARHAASSGKKSRK
ncbi:hypothetical protein FBU59_002264 [Linderina macrospora]|uniref:Uncharacterized protein n=1 Tax=Linderina macrospora TaxID=4868 RepID=A0ACC1JBZ5_9FUNG|nr:hypothetical protein FBU59_002264 [Linderina macrospora]